MKVKEVTAWAAGAVVVGASIWSLKTLYNAQAAGMPKPMNFDEPAGTTVLERGAARNTTNAHDPGTDYFAYRDPYTGKTFGWNVKKLWKLVEGLPVVEMEPLDVPGFNYRHLLGGNQPTIQNIVNECARIERADLSYPIIVSRDHENVMDGAHRLAKAITHDLRVKVVFLEKTPRPDFIQN